jgi:hypothetical protein
MAVRHVAASRVEDHHKLIALAPPHEALVHPLGQQRLLLGERPLLPVPGVPHRPCRQVATEVQKAPYHLRPHAAVL